MAYSPPERVGLWAGLALLAYFGVVMVIDLEHHLILHPTSIAGAVLCAGIGVWRHGVVDTLLGGLAGAGLMLVFYLFGWLFVKVANRMREKQIEEEGMGQGDVILTTVLGLLLGWPGIIAGLTFAILIAGAVSLLVVIIQLITKRYEAFQFIAYGPFLVLGTVVALLWKA